MAAESIGLAASIAGLVSLGLQITGGIATYLDALENRQEELASVRRQNNALTAALTTIKTVSSRLQNHQHDHAVTQSIKSCEAELQAVEVLMAGLADCDTSTWRQRLKSKKKKLSYAFDRTKVQQVSQRLHHADEILQLTLTGLGLDVSASHAESLTAIETSSRQHASELLLVRSDITAAITPMIDIRDQVPLLHNKLDSTAELTISHAMMTRQEVRESSRAIQEDVSHSHNSLQLAIERVEKLQRKTLLALEAANKPAVLRELCDRVQVPKQASSQGLLLEPPRRIQNHALGAIQHPRFASVMGWVCICSRPYRSTKNSKVGWGHVQLSKVLETEQHWPSCPLSNTAKKQRKAISFKYTGPVSILQSVVDFSFAMTSGAGGFSISPIFTYYPAVDLTSDPAFCIMGLLTDCFIFCTRGNIEHFIMHCLRNLVRLFNERKACPTSVSSFEDKSLMHEAALAVRLFTIGSNTPYPRVMSLFREFITTLLFYGVPAFTYDRSGNSPLLSLGNDDAEQFKDVVNVLVHANSESKPATMGSLEYQVDGMWLSEGFIPWTFNSLKFYDISHGYAEACDCGPLSMAVLRNDPNEVAHLLNRYPASLSEVDIYGQSPLHLAAGKPRVLTLLVEAADISILGQCDKAGITALEAAMMISSDHCINGVSSARCRHCTCVQCVNILLEAGCELRMYGRWRDDSYQPALEDIFKTASELARRRYVFHMRKLRTQHQLFDVDDQEAEDYGWIYEEITDTDQADLFYRHEFRPDPSFFFSRKARGNIAYICWLVEHGVDLSLRSSFRPPNVNEDSDFGPYAAHFAFWLLGDDWRYRERTQSMGNEPATFDKLGLNVLPNNLTDGCYCHCSLGGCDPFIWMLKAILEYCHEPNDYKLSMQFFYANISLELTALTYEAAIRYVTFRALGVNHTCCKVRLLITGIFSSNGGGYAEPGPWIERDDVAIINQEQADLLELHEELVAEFTEVAASRFMKIDSDDHSLFPRFWGEYWVVRIDEELEKLDGDELTDAERRGAEELGVRWCEQAEAKKVQENPYPMGSLEHWFFELDLVCPDYKEPWPEELRRVTELQ